MTKARKIGFYRKSKNSNQRLIDLFEKNQKLWYSFKRKDWENKKFIKNFSLEEKKARKEILKMLKAGKVRTSDDFYRASLFFYQGTNYRDYALAVALAAASHHLGEFWGKNLYAAALDHFLLSIKQKQYFISQFQKKRGKWIIAPYNTKTTDKERKEYFVGTFKEALENLQQLESENKKGD